VVHGLDLPGIASVSWLRLARMSTDRSLPNLREEMLDVAGTNLGAWGEIRSLGLGDTRFQAAYFVIRGALIKQFLLLAIL
jgi:hypothetical protein